jgi:hypothetical protein
MFLAVLLVTALVATSIAAQTDAQRGQAKPRSGEPQQQGEPKGRAQPRPSEEPQRRPPETEPQGRAQPRTEGQPQPDSRQRAEPRSPSPPPPRSLPPRYYGLPRVYYFPPVSLQRGYYYHPYFGFYYGPYYGPFYPYPGPYYGQLPYSASAVRTRVRPVETQVYVNGYYAGIVDDFDGVFQRLYLPAGQHEIALYLDGYRSYRQKVYIGPGDTLEISHQMEPLRAGEVNEAAPSTSTLPREWSDTPPPAAGDRPASPFGILAIRVEPADAQIFVDNEAWVAVQGRPELVIHVEAGWHQLEIRKEGYQTFRTEVDLSEGATTRLNVKLVQ